MNPVLCENVRYYHQPLSLQDRTPIGNWLQVGLSREAPSILEGAADGLRRTSQGTVHRPIRNIITRIHRLPEELHITKHPLLGAHVSRMSAVSQPRTSEMPSNNMKFQY